MGVVFPCRSVMVQEQGPSSWPPLTSLPGEVRPDDGSALKPNLVAYQVSGGRGKEGGGREGERGGGGGAKLSH